MPYVVIVKIALDDPVFVMLKLVASKSLELELDWLTEVAVIVKPWKVTVVGVRKVPLLPGMATEKYSVAPPELRMISTSARAGAGAPSMAIHATMPDRT